MKRSVRFIAGIMLVCAGFLLANQQLQAQPVQRVLIEEFTGSWCQFCPMGGYDMVKAIEQYPDNVIGVAIHNKDAMTISEESLLTPVYVGGFPNFTLNRTIGNVKTGTVGSTGQPTQNIVASYIPSMIQNPASVEVTFKSVNYNTVTKKVTVELQAEFFAAMSGDIRFNLYFVEDSVTGTGTGYDQVNAYNTWDNNPFQGKGSPIKGFIHRHVLRKMLGGAWGTSGSLPASVKAGDIKTYTYSETITTWKPDRVSMVAVVQKYDQDDTKRNILNVAEERLTVRSVRPALTVAPSPYLTVGLGTTKEQTITIKNPHSAPITVDVELDGAKSNYPGDWNVTVTPATATIAAGGTTTAKVSFEVPQKTNPALATASIKVTPHEAAGVEAKSNATLVYCLSDNAKYALITGLNAYSAKYQTSLEAIPDFYAGMFSLNFNEQVMAAYSSNFKAIVLPLSGGYFDQNNYQNQKVGFPLAAIPGVNYPNFAKMVTDWLAAGKRVLVDAPRSLWWALDQSTASAQGKNNDAVSLLGTTLGLELAASTARFTETVNGNNISVGFTKYNVRGVTGDVIGDQLAALGNDIPNAGHTFWSDIMHLKNGSKSVPIFFSDEKTANIVGVRYESGDAKLVYLTFGLESLNGAGMNAHMEKIMNWLIGDMKPKMPEISSSTGELDYGSIEVNKSKEMSVDVMNTGGAPLIITKMEIAGTDDKKFTITAGNSGLPITLQPTEKRSVTVKFMPDAEKDFLASLVVTSNSENVENSSMPIDLRGKGTVTAPVKSVLTTAMTTLEFGKVTTSKELAVVITNSGEKELTMNSIEFTGKDNAAFAVKGFKAGTLLGITAANKKLPVTVVFTPGSAGIFAAKMLVKSTITGGGADEFTLDVTGEGVTSGVNEDGSVSGTILTVSAQPNPASAAAMLSYNVGGNAPQTITMNVVDMTGREVANLGSRTVNPGNYATTLDATTLPVGAYHIVVRCATETVTLPFTVTR